MSIDLSQFIPTFLEESFEGLALMESSLLTLDQGDVDTINTIFRAAHSIKGGAGTFGFDRVTDFTHEVETLLDEMRDGRREIIKTDINLLLESVDCIKVLIKAARDNTQCDESHVNQVQKLLQQTLSNETSKSISEYQESSHNSQWKIVFTPHLNMLQTGNDAINIFNALADLGHVTQTVNCKLIPQLSSLCSEDCYLSWELNLDSLCTRSDIEEVFEWVEDECDLDIILLSNTELNDQQLTTDQKTQNLNSNQLPDLSTNSETKSSPSLDYENNSIRVGIDKVDVLINRIGELVITQSMLKKTGSDLFDKDNELTIKLLEGLTQLENTTRDLQDDVMRVRMLPISFVFNRFPRMVHDISTKLNKKIDLKVTGENTELDKTVMEKIGDPLLHLIRNSLDHGLETPEERIALGKSETGVIHLNAYHQGGYIVIDITDDGRGLNTEVIKKKAIEKSIISDDQKLSEQAIHELIFTAGFSTVDQVNDLSGRGVGMDVVKRNIESLGGSITLLSTPNKGTTFSITLPLTLAILDGQLIKVANETYIVPLVSIIESTQIDQAYVKEVSGRPSVYLFRDEFVPIYSIKDLFSLTDNSESLNQEMIIIVENNGAKYALLVDELLEQEQFVLKSLEVNYMPVDGITGATILGDGNVALIIDIRGLIQLNQLDPFDSSIGIVA